MLLARGRRGDTLHGHRVTGDRTLIRARREDVPGRTERMLFASCRHVRLFGWPREVLRWELEPELRLRLTCSVGTRP